MRHLKSFNHLGRTNSHRKAMLSNMASSLILHKRITTSVAKAKSLKVYIEPLITKSKEDNTQSRRIVFSYLQDKHAVSELFREVSPKIINRPGGYTRILKTGFRHGDNADMCIIELVDYNESMLKSSSAAKASTSKKSRRGGTKKKPDVTAKPVAKEKTAKPVAKEEVMAKPVAKTKVKKPVADAPHVVDPGTEVKAGIDQENIDPAAE